MGVRNLQTYCEKINKQICYKVHIKKLIHDFRNEQNSTPVIVIDGICAVLTICRQFSMFQGQAKKYDVFLRNFILSLKEEGAQLVFFFDGPHVSFKRKAWFLRCIKTYNEILDLYDLLEEGYSIHDLQMSTDFSNLHFLTMVVAKDLGCEVHTSIRDGDVEIAEFALKNNCLAVLAQDTDFIIFKHVKYYLSMNNLDFNDLTTLGYDRERLASALDLPSAQLPLVASLLGNDFVLFEKLTQFHKRLLADRVKYCGEKWFDIGKLIPQVAFFIKRRVKNQIQHSRLLLEEIAEDVFNDKSMWKTLATSISYYDLSSALNRKPECPISSNEIWNAVVKKAFELQCTHFVFQYIYSIIVHNHYSLPALLEDIRKKDLPSITKVLRPLRRKLYGILMFENPEVCQIEEWTMDDLINLGKPCYVVPEKPNVEHPGLLSLWNGDSKAHWSLIADVFNVDSFRMRSLPPHLILPALAIRYLNENVKLFSWELPALVSSIVLLQFYKVDELESIPTISDMSVTRPMRLCALVNKTYATVILLFCCFGETIPTKLMTASNYQDGKLFHYKYWEATHNYGVEELCEGKETAIDYYERLMKFITDTKKYLF